MVTGKLPLGILLPNKFIPGLRLGVRAKIRVIFRRGGAVFQWAIFLVTRQHTICGPHPREQQFNQILSKLTVKAMNLTCVMTCCSPPGGSQSFGNSPQSRFATNEYLLCGVVKFI